MESDTKNSGPQAETKIKVHPAADIFPLLFGAEFEGLKADIKKHGVLERPAYLGGLLLDGRNRVRACEELGIEPGRRRDLADDTDAIAFVLSANLHRRHLTSSQRAAVAADALPLIEAEAKKRKATGKSPDGAAGGRGKTLPKELGKVYHGSEATAKAAKLTGTNRQYVADAKKIKAEAPATFEKIKAGKTTIPKAKREITREPGDDTEIIEADRKANAAKRRASGKEVIGPADRTAAKRAFGQLVRFFDKLGRHDEYRRPLSYILAGLDRDADPEGGFEPTEARRPLEKLSANLGFACRDWANVKKILGPSPELQKVFDGLDATSVALDRFKRRQKRSPR